MPPLAFLAPAAITLGFALAGSGGALQGAAADDLAERGAALYKSKCLACHRLEPGVHKVGPSLAGMFERPSGSAEGFRRYSKNLQSAALTWDDAVLDAFLENTRAAVPGNRMIFVGLKKPEDRAAVIAYLKTATR